MKRTLGIPAIFVFAMLLVYASLSNPIFGRFIGSTIITLTVIFCPAVFSRKIRETEERVFIGYLNWMNDHLAVRFGLTFLSVVLLGIGMINEIQGDAFFLGGFIGFFVFYAIPSSFDIMRDPHVYDQLPDWLQSRITPDDI